MDMDDYLLDSTMDLENRIFSKDELLNTINNEIIGTWNKHNPTKTIKPVTMNKKKNFKEKVKSILTLDNIYHELACFIVHDEWKYTITIYYLDTLDYRMYITETNLDVEKIKEV